MTIVLRNNTFTNCGTAMMVGEGACIDIDQNIISDCGRGMVFESELNTNARVRNNKISRCGIGIAIDKKGRPPMMTATSRGPRLKPIAILVRDYILSLTMQI